MNDMRKNQLLSDDASVKITNAFSGLDSSVISSHYKNMNRTPVGRRYPGEVKRFALTMNFYSPRAYEYLRAVFSLPHSSFLSNWYTSVNCDVGFFKDVFLELKNKVEEDPANADCTLLCEATKSKSSTIYNKETGCFEGFVNETI